MLTWLLKRAEFRFEDALRETVDWYMKNENWWSALL